MPSRTSIDAAARPQKTDYFYYVLTPNKDHKFSKTYREHRQAVKVYRQWLREKTD